MIKSYKIIENNKIMSKRKKKKTATNTIHKYWTQKTPQKKELRKPQQLKKITQKYTDVCNISIISDH